MLARLQTAWAAKRLEMRSDAALRHEETALIRLGAQVFEALRSRAPIPEAARESFDAVRAAVGRVDGQAGSLERSLETDRRDFADASQFVRWAVIARGVLERVVLRDRRKRDDHARFDRERDLGRLALDGGHAELRALVPETAAAEIGAVRADAQAARVAATKLLEPYGGQALPNWLDRVVHELRTFLGFVWEQLTKKFFLRAPALAGLLVGWWIAHRYTDSVQGTVLANFGFSDKKAIDSVTKARLEFWLPLLAAATCSYLGWVIARRVQRKYAPRSDAK